MANVSLNAFNMAKVAGSSISTGQTPGGQTPGVPFLSSGSSAARDRDADIEIRHDAQPIKHDHAVVIRLLQGAAGALDRDPPSARDCIARAMALLGVVSFPDRQAEDGAERNRTSSLRGGLTPRQIRKLAEYIDDNLASNLRGVDLARVANLSSSYFARAFKESFGETPHSYVMRRRINHAKTMMLGTAETLSHVAAASGFADQAHFCRSFLRMTGHRPKGWRMSRQHA